MMNMKTFKPDLVRYLLAKGDAMHFVWDLFLDAHDSKPVRKWYKTKGIVVASNRGRDFCSSVSRFMMKRGVITVDYEREYHFSDGTYYEVVYSADVKHGVFHPYSYTIRHRNKDHVMLDDICDIIAYKGSKYIRVHGKSI